MYIVFGSETSHYLLMKMYLADTTHGYKCRKQIESLHTTMMIVSGFVSNAQ